MGSLVAREDVILISTSWFYAIVQDPFPGHMGRQMTGVGLVAEQGAPFLRAPFQPLASQQQRPHLGLSQGPLGASFLQKPRTVTRRESW